MAISRVEEFERRRFAAGDDLHGENPPDAGGEVVLQAVAVRRRVGELLRHRQRPREQRLGGRIIAGRIMGVAELVEGHRQFALIFRIAGIGFQQIFLDRDRPLGHVAGAGDRALIDQRVRQFLQRRRFEVLQRRRRGVGLRELALHGLGAAENVQHQADRHAGLIAQLDRQIVDQMVRGQRRGIERALGLGALGLRGVPLPGRGARQHQKRSCGRPRQRQRAALLAHFLREQILLRNAVNGRGEVGCEIEEFAVSRRRAVAVVAHIDPFRLGGESSLQLRRQRRRGGEIVRGAVPGELALGERQQTACRCSCARANRRSPCRPMARPPTRGDTSRIR